MAVKDQLILIKYWAAMVSIDEVPRTSNWLTSIKLYPIRAQVLFVMFLYLAEAVLSGGNEGSLSSESDDESGDEPEMSQGTV